MNALGIQLLWTALQVTLVGTACWALRRLVRSHDASITLAGLVVACGLLATAWLPLPSWWERVPDTATAAFNEEASPVESPRNVRGTAPRERTMDGAVMHDATPTSWLDFMSWELIADAARDSSTATTSGWNWPAVVALACLAAIALGLGQLAIGIAGVAAVRHRSTLLTDSNLSELLATICAELDIVRPVRLYESRQLATAATVGWRRPAILLPPQWRLWSAAQQRAVLAHELAHVRRGDYFTGLLAQLSVALQFYHPVMHWLGHRLRLEQELAADAVAARILGGEQAYLHSLVELALEQSDQTLGWPARNFLPTRGTFMRRIEMLRSSSGLVRRPLTQSRIAACGVLVIVGIAASGLRSPLASNGQILAAQKEVAASATVPEQPKEFDLQHVPDDAAALVIWRPAQVIASSKIVTTARDLVAQMKTESGVDLQHLTQMAWVVKPESKSSAVSALLLLADRETACILNSSEPKELRDLVEKVLPAAQATQIGPYTIHKSMDASKPYACYLPDEHTLIIDHIDTIARFMVGERGNPKITRSPLWQTIAEDPIVGIVDVRWFATRMLPQAGETSNTPAAALAMQLLPFAPLYRDTEVAAASLSLDETTRLRLLASTSTEDRATRVQRTADAGLVLLDNYLEQTRPQISKLAAEQQVVAHSLLSLAESALGSATVEREGTTVELSTTVPLQQAIQLGILAPALEAQRAAAAQARSTNNLKQIGLALHNYVDVHGSFPPPVLTSPDGKTKYSWRVAILPYLDQDALYRQYNFGEPWDSPANRKVLEQMPAVFRSASADQKAHETPVLALVAPGAIFNDTGKGTSMAEIRDGTSNTVMIIESRSTIPWTKPEDLAFDIANIPILYGRTGNFTPALYGDGSVRMLAEETPQDVLRALITARGNEVLPGIAAPK